MFLGKKEFCYVLIYLLAKYSINFILFLDDCNSLTLLRLNYCYLSHCNGLRLSVIEDILETKAMCFIMRYATKAEILQQQKIKEIKKKMTYLPKKIIIQIKVLKVL